MTATRRRGEELEAAIHRAVFDEVTDVGYAGLTFAGVAARAGTSKPVLYRRWPTKAEMVFAAVLWTAQQGELRFPDTGDLAGDIVGMLTTLRGFFSRLGRHTVLGLLLELDDDGSERLQAALFARSGEWLEPLLARARARGELGPSDLPPHVRSLPFDLVRHEMFVRGVVSDSYIEAVTRDVVVPAYKAHSFVDGGGG